MRGKEAKGPVLPIFSMHLPLIRKLGFAQRASAPPTMLLLRTLQSSVADLECPALPFKVPSDQVPVPFLPQHSPCPWRQCLWRSPFPLPILIFSSLRRRWWPCLDFEVDMFLKPLYPNRTGKVFMVTLLQLAFPHPH